MLRRKRNSISETGECGERIRLFATKLKEEKEHNKALQEKVDDLEISVQNMDKVIGELTPKANYVDVILQSKSTVLTTQIAQD